MEEMVYKPLPAILQDLRERATREFIKLPDALLAKAVFGMKKKSLKLLKTEEKASEGKKKRL